MATERGGRGVRGDPQRPRWTAVTRETEVIEVTEVIDVTEAAAQRETGELSGIA